MKVYLSKLEKDMQEIKDIAKRDGLSHLTGPQLVKQAEIDTVQHFLKKFNDNV
jgi:hypothetical protein